MGFIPCKNQTSRKHFRHKLSGNCCERNGKTTEPGSCCETSSSKSNQKGLPCRPGRKRTSARYRGSVVSSSVGRAWISLAWFMISCTTRRYSPVPRLTEYGGYAPFPVSIVRTGFKVGPDGWHSALAAGLHGLPASAVSSPATTIADEALRLPSTTFSNIGQTLPPRRLAGQHSRITDTPVAPDKENTYSAKISGEKLQKQSTNHRQPRGELLHTAREGEAPAEPNHTQTKQTRFGRSLTLPAQLLTTMRRAENSRQTTNNRVASYSTRHGRARLPPSRTTCKPKSRHGSAGASPSRHNSLQPCDTPKTVDKPPTTAWRATPHGAGGRGSRRAKPHANQNPDTVRQEPHPPGTIPYNHTTPKTADKPPTPAWRATPHGTGGRGSRQAKPHANQNPDTVLQEPNHMPVRRHEAPRIMWIACEVRSAGDRSVCIAHHIRTTPPATTRRQP